MLRTILTVAGKPGLYKLISSGRNMLIVEAIDATKKRLPIHNTDKVVSLGDIAMYTDDEEVPLWQVLENAKTICEGNLCSLDHKKASNEELAEWFAQVLPNYDRDRVYMSHVRKLIQWYNLLTENGLTVFVPEDETDDTTEEA